MYTLLFIMTIAILSFLKKIQWHYCYEYFDICTSFIGYY
jgi:hypothetical protein